MLNNYQLARFKANLYNYPLPPQTQITDQQAEVGLTGNSNHCDFVVEQTAVTNLSREEVEAYYATVEFPPARSEAQGPEDFWTTGVHRPVRPLLTFQDNRNSEEQLEFTVSLVDFGYPAGFDFRCH